MLLETINKTVILTLDKRLEDAKNLKTSLKSKNIDAQLFVAGYPEKDTNIQYNYIDTLSFPPIYIGGIDYRTWYSRPNAFNAWKCHRKIFLEALENDVDNLFLLEDDSILEDDFDEILESCESFFKTRHWDMIYFGCYHNNNSIETSNENVLKMGGGGGFHAVLMNKEILNELVKAHPIGPFDWIAGKFLHSEYDCYAIYPCIISQKSGYSFVEGQDLTKPERFIT